MCSVGIEKMLRFLKTVYHLDYHFRRGPIQCPTILNGDVSHPGYLALESGSSNELWYSFDCSLHWILRPSTNVQVAALCHKQDMVVIAYAHL